MARSKVITLLAAVMMITSAASLSFAYPVGVGEYIKVTAYSGATGGGEFTVKNSSNVELFKSFCLERDEFLSPNTLYKINDISTSAIQGGINTNAGDPLNPRTAYLFYHFTIGDLKVDSTHPYNKLDSVYGQDALQRAIWMIEEELSLGDSGYDVSNVYYVLAGKSEWSDVGAVRVLNLVGDTSPGQAIQYKQSILVLTPEPSTLLVLGLGLAGLAAIRRKI